MKLKLNRKEAFKLSYEINTFLADQNAKTFTLNLEKTAKKKKKKDDQLVPLALLNQQHAAAIRNAATTIQGWYRKKQSERNNLEMADKIIRIDVTDEIYQSMDAIGVTGTAELNKQCDRVIDCLRELEPSIQSVSYTYFDRVNYPVQGVRFMILPKQPEEKK